MTPTPEPPAAERPPANGDESREERRGKAPALTICRYGAMNWAGEFTHRPDALQRCGAPVVVQTERGIELGQQLELCCESHPACVSREQIRRYVDNSGPDFCRPAVGRILREATPQDVDEHRRLNAHARDDMAQCAAVAAQLGLDIKVVAVEHLLGGERIVFYFRAEGRIDFRDLVKELAHGYRTRIEMRQVGARDEARLVADWEVCGRECCCKNFLKTLRPVNMKMAKLQKSTLDPAKVSGRCGRLRCCLRYENEGYQELAARLPRKGSRVRAALGEGFVVEHQVLTQLVTIRGDDEKDFTVPLEEITAFDLPKPPPRPAASGASAGEEPESAPGQAGARPHGRRPGPSRTEGAAREINGAVAPPRIAPQEVNRTPPPAARESRPGPPAAQPPMPAQPGPAPLDRAPGDAAPPDTARPSAAERFGGPGSRRRRGRRRRRRRGPGSPPEAHGS